MTAKVREVRDNEMPRPINATEVCERFTAWHLHNPEARATLTASRKHWTTVLLFHTTWSFVNTLKYLTKQPFLQQHGVFCNSTWLMSRSDAKVYFNVCPDFNGAILCNDSSEVTEALEQRSRMDSRAGRYDLESRLIEHFPQAIIEERFCFCPHSLLRFLWKLSTIFLWMSAGWQLYSQLFHVSYICHDEWDYTILV